jgi:hypothetical protein
LGRRTIGKEFEIENFQFVISYQDQTSQLIPIRETAGHITFSIKVQPRAKKNAITGIVGDALKISLTAPPVDGKANRAVIEFFSGIFKIPRSSITIASGETSRLKVIRISGVDQAMVARCLTDAAGNLKLS